MSVLACLDLFATACGSSTTEGADPGTGTFASDPGTGTGTLLVTAWFKVENVVDNAADRNGFNTAIYVDVSTGSQPISARVVVKSSLGARTLEFTSFDYLGAYRG